MTSCQKLAATVAAQGDRWAMVFAPVKVPRKHKKLAATVAAQGDRWAMVYTPVKVPEKVPAQAQGGDQWAMVYTPVEVQEPKNKKVKCAPGYRIPKRDVLGTSTH